MFWLEKVGIEAHLFHGRSRKGVRGALGTRRNGVEETVQGKSMTSLESFQRLEWLGAWVCLLDLNHKVMLLRGTGALIPHLLMGRRMRDCDEYDFARSKTELKS